MMRKQKPLMSIIIPTYNRATLLRYTLSSIVDQKFDSSRIEVIIVDDGSTDHTANLTNSYSKFLNLIYLYQEDEGYGVAKARNLGISHATSDILLFVDSGVALEKNCVLEHIKTHITAPGPASVIGYVYGFCTQHKNQIELQKLIDEEGELTKIIDRMDCEGVFLDSRAAEFREFDHRIDLLPAPWAYYWTGNVSLNRNCLFSDRPFFDLLYNGRYGYEDLDLGYRLHQNGVRILVNRKAKSLHFPHKRKMNMQLENEINETAFRNKHSSEVVELFCQNKGTFGFNKLLLTMATDSFFKMESLDVGQL